MKNYLELLGKIKLYGEYRKNRTGINNYSLFGERLVFDIGDSFPLITTKKVHYKSIFTELVWFIKGDTNIKFLHDNKVTIWDEWADDNGNLGPIYGKQWRAWETNNNQLDQLQKVIDDLKFNYNSRRMIVSTWNVGQLKEMKLAPCHILYQFYVSNKKDLCCQVYQRSADMFLGVPFNIASYAALTYLIAKICDLKPKKLIMIFGDIHIYENHLNAVNLQLQREPKALPQLIIDKDIKNIDNVSVDAFKLKNYEHYDVIKADVAV